MANEKASLILFDFFGTLVDMKSQGVYKTFLEHTNSQKDTKTFKENILTRNYGNLNQVLSENRDLLHFEDPKREIPNLQVKLEEEIASAKVFTEVPAILQTLKSKGYELGLISNLASPYKQVFEQLDLGECFEQPTFSCDVGYKKPQKEIFEIARNKVNLPLESIYMVGDSFASDVIGARNSSWIKGIHLKRTTPKKELEKNQISTLTQLLDILK